MQTDFHERSGNTRTEDMQDMLNEFESASPGVSCEVVVAPNAIAFSVFSQKLQMNNSTRAESRMLSRKCCVQPGSWMIAGCGAVWDICFRRSFTQS